MNEREEFLQYFQSVFPKMVERIETMTETQVLDGLAEVKAARNIYREEFAERIEAMTQAQVPDRPPLIKAWRSAGELPDLRSIQAYFNLRSIQAYFNGVSKLRSQLGAGARSGGSAPSVFDSLEDALQQRLETIRKSSSNDS